MNIIWQYLDKRGAAINALKDYSSMAYIIDHTDEEIANIHDDMTSIGSPAFSDMPSNISNPQSGEIRLTAAIDEIDVLHERYRTWNGFSLPGIRFPRMSVLFWSSFIWKMMNAMMHFLKFVTDSALSVPLHTKRKTVQ